LVVRIALLQTEGVPLDVVGNLGKLRVRANEAAAAGAEVLVCPELYVTGYNIGEQAIELAEPADGSIFERAAEIARSSSIAILYGYPERHGESVFNAAQLINAAGQSVVNYRKTHLYGGWEQRCLNSGSELTTGLLGEVRIGVLICYDVEFPETVRSLALQGAEVVLVPTAVGAKWAHLPSRLIPMRAFENQIFVAYANHCGSENDMAYCGRSCAAAPDGTILAIGGEGEELLVTDLLLGSYGASRELTPYLDDRRPSLYSKLVERRT
jgi:predicted amidohydrolase